MYMCMYIYMSRLNVLLLVKYWKKKQHSNSGNMLLITNMVDMPFSLFFRW